MTRITGVLLAAAMVLSAAPALAAQVDRRERRQHARIEQGEKSGALTPAEAARLDARETKISRETAHDRAAHGGHLTAAERRKLQREETRNSEAIARETHNAVHE